ncbi:hypothetical protein DYB32_010739, partial [Aphanomyces invadans]
PPGFQPAGVSSSKAVAFEEAESDKSASIESNGGELSSTHDVHMIHSSDGGDRSASSPRVPDDAISPREALLRAQYAHLQQQDSLYHDTVDVGQDVDSPHLSTRHDFGEADDDNSDGVSAAPHTRVMSPREALLRAQSTSMRRVASTAAETSPRTHVLQSQRSKQVSRDGSSERLDANEAPMDHVAHAPTIVTKRQHKLVERVHRSFPGVVAFVNRLWPPTPENWDKDMANAMLCTKPGRDYLGGMLVLPFVCIVYAFLFFKFFGEPLRDDSFSINVSDSMLNGYMVLIVLFELAIMMWDRAAFVVGSVKVKAALHYTVLVGVHLGLWIMLPVYSQSYFQQRVGLQVFYFLHCVYLWLSASQIKHGYVVFRSNHYSKKAVDKTSLADEVFGKVFKVYMFIPFAFEIRCLLDWMCSTTSLNKDMWLLLEETAATLYLVRQEMDERIRDAVYLKGNKRHPVVQKFFTGGVILVVMLLCVVAPLAMFSSLNPTTVENEIKSTAVVFGLVQQDGTLQQFYANGDTNSDKYTGLNIKASDTVIQKNSYASYSNDVWASSPPLRRNLVARINSTETLKWSLRLTFTRDGPEGNQVVSTSFEKDLTPMDRVLLMNMVLNKGSTADPVRTPPSSNSTLVLSTTNQTSISITTDTITMPSIRIAQFYSPVLKVGASTNPVVRSLYAMRDVEVQRNAEDGVSWWVLRSPDPAGNSKNGIAVQCFDRSGADKDGFCVITISDNIVTGLTKLGIGSYGLTAVYIFVVFTVGAFFKDMLRGAMYTVLYQELPNPNDLMDLVEVRGPV